MQETLKIVYEAIDELNETLDTPLEKSESLVIFGPDAQLNSMEIVSLIISIERLVDEKFGKSITLASEKAFSRSSSPFKTPATLAEYVDELLKEAE